MAAAFALAIASTASAQTVDELIAKNIEAKGGREKIKAVQTMRMHGKMMMGGGMEAPFTIVTKRPQMMRLEFSFQGLTGVQAYDGSNAWMVMPFTGKKDPEQMTAEDTKQVQEQADFDGPLFDYKEKGHKVELLGKEQVEGADAYKLKLTLKSGEERTIWLDADTHLELKSEGKRKMRGTDVEFEGSMGDYKEVDGLMIAHAMEQGAKGSPQRQKMVIDKIELNPALADTLFLMPATAKKAATPDAAKTPEAAAAETKDAKSDAAATTEAKTTDAPADAKAVTATATADSAKAAPKKKKKK
jgi:outer membrane lipoprotein-sorting protein